MTVKQAKMLYDYIIESPLNSSLAVAIKVRASVIYGQALRNGCADERHARVLNALKELMRGLDR